MATSAEAVRSELQVTMAASTADLVAEAAGAPPDLALARMIDALDLIIPSYYDAAASLAVDWYEELREESKPSGLYVPRIIGNPSMDWIEREVEKFRREAEAGIEAEMAAMARELERLAEKEVARGFRDSITGNARLDSEAIGWSRVTRPGACKFCLMLADRGAVYRSESTAIFAAHSNCHCASRPEFRNGEHGEEANAVQYLASSKRARDSRVQAQRNAKVRAYLNANYPDARG